MTTRVINVAVFDAHRFDRDALERALAGAAAETGAPAEPGISLRFLEVRLNARTAALADGCDAVCAFVNDCLDEETLRRLSATGVRMVALRCAGFNHVDLRAARQLGLGVARVPAYSPYAIAEHAVALILALNRKIVRASGRVRDGNFSLEGLVGFDLHGKTVGVVGTGKIGAAFARIMRGFGCVLLGADPAPDAALSAETGLEYCSLPELLGRSDIVSLHLPLHGATRHVLDEAAIGKMRHGAMLINTGRGALVDTVALMEGLKNGQIGAVGLDVYEEEEGVFFEDHSGEVLRDEKLAWLLMCPNVLITAHQAFLTREALDGLASTTLLNLREYRAAALGLAHGPPDPERWLVAPQPPQPPADPSPA
jgi:D-lactate dehydrogenase